MTAPENAGGHGNSAGDAESMKKSGACAKPGAAACSGAARLTQWRHSLLLFGLGASWGLQFVLLKIAADAELDELSILTIAMFLLAIAYLAVMSWRRTWFRPTRRHFWFFLISAFFGFVVPLGGVILVAGQLSAGLIVFFESLTPVFTVAIVLLAGCERLSASRFLAVALGMMGVLLVLWPDLANPGSARLESLLFALIIPLAYAIDAVYVAARWPQDLRAFQVVTGEAIAATAMLLPFFLWRLVADSRVLAGLQSAWFIEPWGWGQWAVLAFVPVSFLEVYLYFYLLRHAGAVFVSIGSFISLFAGIVWGMLLLGESHPASVWAAVLLVSVALALAKEQPEKAAQSEKPPAISPASE